ncbi:hypothetical protein CQ018_17285 [Arthrobacter sp. MYb227]|uniref:response regulator transcription factor n=1 Tax=Arthrobacter sp. MYb227 TaxID=1848601 RepID=UPI000CFBCB20|nr:response regulator transcription factor [Arthrobacter sp. MYb227]PQZ87705.1 hypothetical protein CQ018_17285 [Arthrobacter sp. MYb227]
MPVTPIRVHLADADPFLRLGLERMLEASPDILLEQVTENGTDAAEAAVSAKPEIVLMESSITNVGSLEATRRIRAHAPLTKIVIFSAIHDIETMSRSYSAGAHSYLAKSSIATDLAPAIRLIVSGNEIFSKPANASNFSEHPTRKYELQTQFLRQANPRDKRLLIALAQGKTNSQIASILHVSEGTVKAQIAKLMEPLHIQTRVQLAVLVAQAGLLEQNKVSLSLSVGLARPTTPRA